MKKMTLDEEIAAHMTALGDEVRSSKRRITNARWRATHRERYLALARAANARWRAKNRRRCADATKRWREANRERWREYMRKWRLSRAARRQAASEQKSGSQGANHDDAQTTAQNQKPE